jgi:hypothetical protein
MAQPLLPGGRAEGDDDPGGHAEASLPQEMADLRIFWGPEICRLEYLLHLLDTGRVKDDHLTRSR